RRGAPSRGGAGPGVAARTRRPRSPSANHRGRRSPRRVRAHGSPGALPSGLDVLVGLAEALLVLLGVGVVVADEDLVALEVAVAEPALEDHRDLGAEQLGGIAPVPDRCLAVAEGQDELDALVGLPDGALDDVALHAEPVVAELLAPLE